VERVDVLIVGGGPAGSSLAFGLRGSGLRVRIVDRARFPRDKPCAGWVTPPVFAALGIDPRAYAATGRTLQPIRGFAIASLGREPTRVAGAGVVSHGIRRCELDGYLLARCGAELRLGEPVRAIERRSDGWLVDGAVHTRLLVGAGGHFCPVARAQTAGQPKETPIAAQEIELPLDAASASRLGLEAEVPQIFFTRDLAGYGWAFRKGGYLNVGLGRRGGEGLSEQLRAFLDELRLRGRVPNDWGDAARGHAYHTYGTTRRPLRGDGVALVGDAAGLAYPKSGEGIRPAVESGLLLARALDGARDPADEAVLARYADAIVARFGTRAAQPGAPPAAWQARVAPRLFGIGWFARRVVVERWFLNAGQPALAASA